jgi:hypothetical protein
VFELARLTDVFEIYDDAEMAKEGL